MQAYERSFVHHRATIAAAECKLAVLPTNGQQQFLPRARNYKHSFATAARCNYTVIGFKTYKRKSEVNMSTGLARKSEWQKKKVT